MNNYTKSKEYTKPTRSFLRVLWGNPWKAKGCLGSELINDLLLLTKNEIEVKNPKPFFVFGSENMKRLVDMGMPCILIDKKENVLPAKQSTYHHKLLAYDIATQMFDEIVALDIDCQQVRELPKNFWEIHNIKASIQIPLIAYQRSRAYWRIQTRKNGSFKVVPCACYVYLRGNKVAKSCLKIIEKMKQHPAMQGRIFSEEDIFAMLTDDIMGGWDQTKYIEQFEPNIFSTGKISSQLGPQPPYFIHYLRTSSVRKALKKIKIFSATTSLVNSLTVSFLPSKKIDTNTTAKNPHNSRTLKPRHITTPIKQLKTSKTRVVGYFSNPSSNLKEDDKDLKNGQISLTGSPVTILKRKVYYPTGQYVHRNKKG
jgi:hypothetical protein